jgi:hypothetical protein
VIALSIVIVVAADLARRWAERRLAAAPLPEDGLQTATSSPQG